MDDLFSCEAPSIDGCSSAQYSSVEADANGSNHQYLMKIEPDGDVLHAPLFMLVSERSDLYYLEVSDGTHTWIGTYAYDSMQGVAKHAKMSVNDVAMETRMALTGSINDQQDGSVQSEYVYIAIPNPRDNSIQLTWKKQLADNSNIKVTLGEVTLEPCQDDEVHARIMEFAVMEIRNLKRNISKLTKTKKQLTEERAAALKRLEQCVDLKEEIEGDLYGKFKLVLNEKKAKVRGLMETLKKVKEGSVTITTNKQSLTTSTLNDESTDDEVDSDAASIPSPKTSVPVKHKQTLLEDQQQDEGLSPPVKKRKRTKNQTTGSVILSRPSAATPTTANRRSSSRENDDIQSQDLINMM